MVIILGKVTVLDPPGLTVLLWLHDKVTASATEIHLATAQRDDVHRAGHITGLDQLFRLNPTVEAVIADVPAERHERARHAVWMMRTAGQNHGRRQALAQDS